MRDVIDKTITRARVEDAVREQQSGCGHPGFCLACGADADGCEPDAEGYECEVCGAAAVCGAELIYLSHFV